jgi:hypothetical protein
MRLRLLLVAALVALTLSACAATSSTPPAPTPTATSAPTAPPTGAISGTLGYPSSFIPQLRVYAVSVASSGVSFHVDTAANQSTYTISDVTPGTYHVIAYLVPDNPALRGGYSQFVLCGLAASCPSHALVDVVVTAGKTAANINPTDWYAPEGSFPAPPQ